MDIRWKNTADKAKAFLKENISSVTGTAAFILGLIMLVFLSDKVKYYVSSKETWGFGIIMNVFMGIAVYLILSDVLKNIYRDWLPENSDFYSSWKNVWKKQQRILWTAGGALFFIAMFFLISQMTYSRYYYSNFAFGYLLVATAVVQFGIAKLTVTRFMNRRLDLLMDSVNEINKERLCEAIEIEKNSIEKAAKSEQLKVDLISNVSHDLKTPLTSVIGYLSLLDEVPDMPQQQKAKYVNIALDKARRLEKLINEFFDITRYNLQQIELEEERLDLSYMLVQMADEFYPILKAHGNTIRVEAAEDLTVYGDSLKLARVFNNLLKNAVYYSYPNTEITIRAEQLAQAVRISFSNQGKTIPAQKLNAVFEKFFRLDEARSTNTGGAGLGLAIAKEIVTLHGGTISAKSECEQTTFCVMLPAEE